MTHVCQLSQGPVNTAGLSVVSPGLLSGSEALRCQADGGGRSGGEEAVQRKEEPRHDFTRLQVEGHARTHTRTHAHTHTRLVLTFCVCINISASLNTKAYFNSCFSSYSTKRTVQGNCKGLSTEVTRTGVV